MPATSAAAAQFTAITKDPLGHHESGFGVAWGDYDGDGDASTVYLIRLSAMGVERTRKHILFH